MSCPKFIAQSFAVRTAAHLAHLSSRSYAQHVALNEFYDGLVPLVDKYAEVYTGLEGKIPVYPSVTPPAHSNPTELVTQYLLAVRQEIEADDEGSQALLNILAELEELTAQTLYKLKFLK
jgi:hypothetical protein